MKSEFATLLTPPHNFAVVQLPTRQFPGVVIQGDSLSILVELRRDISRALAAGNTEEATYLLDEMAETLESALGLYIRTLTAAGKKLPFVMDQN